MEPTTAPILPSKIQEEHQREGMVSALPVAHTIEVKANECERGKVGSGVHAEPHTEAGHALAGAPPAFWMGGSPEEAPNVSRVCQNCYYIVLPGTSFCAKCGSKCYISTDFMTAAAGLNPGAPRPKSNSAGHQEGMGPAGGRSGVGASERATAPDLTAATSNSHERVVEPMASKAADRESPSRGAAGDSLSDPDGWMRECEIQIDDLPLECAGILLWRSALRRSIAVASNRTDCRRVMEWFNKAWAPGVTIYDLMDSGPFGTLDMRLANKTQHAVVRAKTNHPTNMYVARLYKT